jgi:hypothetical protein
VIGVINEQYYPQGGNEFDFNVSEIAASGLSSGNYTIKMNADGVTDFIQVQIVK